MQGRIEANSSLAGQPAELRLGLLRSFFDRLLRHGRLEGDCFELLFLNVGRGGIGGGHAVEHGRQHRQCAICSDLCGHLGRTLASLDGDGAEEFFQIEATVDGDALVWTRETWTFDGRLVTPGPTTDGSRPLPDDFDPELDGWGILADLAVDDC